MLTYRSPERKGEREAEASAAGDGIGGGDAPPTYDLIELFFFAYRDFVGDADRRLADLRFGRAHHRVLHFVNRHPGLTVNELLDILKITKQSLNRVMKDLTDEAFIEVQAGVADRRQRLLYPTARGQRLALDLAHLQSERFRRALETMPPGGRAAAVAFLLNMIDPGERRRAMELVGGPPAAPRGERAA